MWEVYLTDEVNEWLDGLLDDDPDSHRQVVYAIEALAEGGPNLGRPLVDRIKGSSVHNLKELRPGSKGATEIRVLFAFDPWRSSILLVAGDKAGRWREWYREAIPRAEQLYEIYLKERAAEEGMT
ncbi:MAG TPA: type II toxin-antitoxin system RelE/ParE family toxin [Pseudonocardia sp.]